MGALESSTRLFTPDEVLKMVAAGVLAEDEPVELIAGRLVVVSPQGPAHSFTVGTLADRLQRLYEPNATAREEKPLQLSRTGCRSLTWRSSAACRPSMHAAIPVRTM